MSNDASVAQVRGDGDSEPTDEEMVAFLRSMVLDDGYPCVGAKSVFTRRTAQVEVFEHLAQSGNSSLYDGLARFADACAEVGDDTLVSYVAVFRGPRPGSELDFEDLLWRQLDILRRYDQKQRHVWDPSVSPDPVNPHFGFSLHETAFFVIGMHPGASRQARRTPWPVLVFNLHRQFEALRSAGRFARVRDTVRRRDIRLQGSINPMVADHGSVSEARQYSGRAVPENWRPPTGNWPHSPNQEGQR